MCHMPTALLCTGTWCGQLWQYDACISSGNLRAYRLALMHEDQPHSAGKQTVLKAAGTISINNTVLIP